MSDDTEVAERVAAFMERVPDFMLAEIEGMTVDAVRVAQEIRDLAWRYGRLLTTAEILANEPPDITPYHEATGLERLWHVFAFMGAKIEAGTGACAANDGRRGGEIVNEVIAERNRLERTAQE